MNVHIWDIYLIWTVSSSAHSSNLILTKKPRTHQVDLLKNQV